MEYNDRRLQTLIAEYNGVFRRFRVTGGEHKKIPGPPCGIRGFKTATTYSPTCAVPSA